MNRKGDGEHFQTNGLIHLFIFYDKVLDIYFFRFKPLRIFLLLNGNAFFEWWCVFSFGNKAYACIYDSKGPGTLLQTKEKKKEEN